MSKLYYYNQLSYGNVPYNKPDGTHKTIKTSGCGVCSACIVFNTLAQKELYSVAEMAKFSKAHGARTNNGTDENTLLNALCKANKGFSWKSCRDVKELVKHLQSGGMAICNQGDAYNVFSDAGHFVVAWRMDGKNIEVADPSNTSNKYNLFNRPSRIVRKTAYGCIVKPSIMKKATADRYPSYYLISYKEEKKDMSVKTGDVITLNANNICYKSTAKDAYTISEITKFFFGEQKARLRKGKKFTVKAVDKVNGDVWCKITVNDKAVYILAYKKETGKWYIKA